MKKNTLLSSLSILSLTLGLFIFASTHSNFKEEIDEVLITGLNFAGEHYSFINTLLIFLIPGIISVLVTLSSIKKSRNKVENRIAQTLLFITGTYWLSFGVLTVNPFDEVSWSSFNIRSMIFQLILLFTVFFLTLASRSLTGQKISSWITGGYLIFLLITYSATLMEMFSTFHLTNISFLLFFIWLVYFGWANDFSKVQTNESIKNPKVNYSFGSLNK